MDLKQLEYIIKIAEENNITHAAKKLFLTQSALNQQLLKLEKELGTELFHRSRTDWRPTEAGEIYIAAAKEILHIKQDTYNRIFDLERQQRGKLSVGFTPNRGTAMFSAVYPKFHNMHPQVIVEPVELSVAEQLEQIANHTLDIGFLTLLPPFKKTGYSYYPIQTEEIYLAIPASHAVLYPSGRGNGSEFPLLSLEELKKEAFVLLYKRSTIRTLVDLLFHDAGFNPQILFETSSTFTILHMIEAGLCCGLVPAYYVDQSNSKIRYYALPERPSWEIISCSSKNSYLSEAAKNFISLAKEYWLNSAAPAEPAAQTYGI